MATNNELLDDVIFAARSGDLDDLKNANPNADYFVTKNDMGNTALHMASANGHEGQFYASHFKDHNNWQSRCIYRCGSMDGWKARWKQGRST